MGVLVAPVEARHESLLARAASALGERGRTIALVTAATVLATLIAGYHPYSEDGGIYVASVKQLLDPGLYPHDAAFAMEPSRWSLFAPAVAGLVRLAHVPLPWVLLALHVASVWATLFAADMLASRLSVRREARGGAVVLLACWLGLPVAGTALYVMDPYLTARSLATPAMILAIIGTLDATQRPDPARRGRGWALWGGGLAVCVTMHPLTAMYAGFATTLLACIRARSHAVRVWGVAGLCAAATIGAACMQMLAPPESGSYTQAALSRSYWFFSEWQWYEIAGLVAPLVILGIVAWTRRAPRWHDPAVGFQNAVSGLALMAVIVGAIASVIAMLFAHEKASTHLLARLQPLRMFQAVYVVMIIMLGGWLGEHVLRRSVWRWGVAIALLGGAMFGVARAEYSGSEHLELPWLEAKNPWVQTFEWVRSNTPKDALFAVDADYVHTAYEDAQGFRAIAERSMLPDRSKDGGEASIAPDLADTWARGVAAQDHLNAISDDERVVLLRPLGVTWVVLDAEAKTALPCPYASANARVCRLM